MKITVAASLACVSLASFASADGLRKEFVPANAKWLAHVDVEGIRRSKTATSLSGRMDILALKHDADIDEFERELGIEIERDILSVTIYGTTDAVDHPVVVIHATSEIDRAMRRVETLPEHRRDAVAGHRVHRLARDGSGESGAWTMYVLADGDERHLVLADDDEELAHGIRLLEGKGKSLASVEGGALTATPREGSLVFVSIPSGFTKLAEIEATSAVVRLAKSATFDLSERRGELRATLTVSTDNVDDATKVAQVVQGAMALASLAASDGEAPSALRNLIGALTVDTRGSTVHVSFRYDAERLIEDLQSLEGADGDGVPSSSAWDRAPYLDEPRTRRRARRPASGTCVRAPRAATRGTRSSRSRRKPVRPRRSDTWCSASRSRSTASCWCVRAAARTRRSSPKRRSSARGASSIGTAPTGSSRRGCSRSRADWRPATAEPARRSLTRSAWSTMRAAPPIRSATRARAKSGRSCGTRRRAC